MDLNEYGNREIKKMIYDIKVLYKKDSKYTNDFPDLELIYHKFYEVAVYIVENKYIDNYYSFLDMMEDIFSFLKELDYRISEVILHQFSVEAWGASCTIKGKNYPHLYSYAYRYKPFFGRYSNYLIFPMWVMPWTAGLHNLSDNGTIVCAILASIWYIFTIEFNCKNSTKYTAVLILFILSMYGITAAFEINTNGADSIPTLISLTKWVYIPFIIITTIWGLNKGFSDYLASKDKYSKEKFYY